MSTVVPFLIDTHKRVQFLTQAVLEVTVADLVCENVDHHLEELQVSLT